VCSGSGAVSFIGRTVRWCKLKPWRDRCRCRPIQGILMPRNPGRANPLPVFNFKIFMLFKSAQECCSRYFIASCFIAPFNQLNSFFRKYYRMLETNELALHVTGRIKYRPSGGRSVILAPDLLVNTNAMEAWHAFTIISSKKFTLWMEFEWKFLHGFVFNQGLPC